MKSSSMKSSSMKSSYPQWNPTPSVWLCCTWLCSSVEPHRQCGSAVPGCAAQWNHTVSAALLYLAVQLLVQLTDALRQLGQLLGDGRVVDRLSRVRLHVEVIRQEVRVAACKHSVTAETPPTPPPPPA
ncbi:hypothetical protein EYF80_055216 [Liparis tanakae]|uniref:Uncharacterized protein n=1 Tax=Liparis tanakae TaxID=230148 RepID=A0A4Z2F0A4_9TELE|nr:hypothetical protein EYF80_055216 [Liparis tanakae]